jgi:hypothetical protein
MAPFKDKHHPSTLSDVGTHPVGPAGVVLEEWRAVRHFHALTRDRRLNVGSGSNPDFLLGGRTSASAECRHWSGRAVRWSSCAILLSSPRPKGLWQRQRREAKELEIDLTGKPK